MKKAGALGVKKQQELQDKIARANGFNSHAEAQEYYAAQKRGENPIKPKKTRTYEKRGKNKRYNPYRRVRIEGGSQVVTLGAAIPPDWRMVKVEVIEEEADVRLIRFQRVN